MKIADVLLYDLDAEIASTRRTLERVPEDKTGWKPHEKSTPIEKLALHIATLPRFGTFIVTESHFDMAVSSDKLPKVEYTSKAETIAEFDRNTAAARNALAVASDADLEAKWKFSYGDKVIAELPRAASFRMFFVNHMMHHRAQLGVYFRLLDVPVPSCYGPTADDHMGF